MIHLFPRLRNKMALSSAIVIGMVALLMLMNPSLSPLAAMLIAVAGVLIMILTHYLTAANMHNQLLSRLYNQLDVEGFLRDYEPFLDVKLKNPNLYLMIRLHLSNAYCAQGRFDEAMALLSSVDVKNAKKPEDELLSRFAVVSNLCYCAQQKNDVASAKEYLRELLALKAKLVALQEKKPEKKRMVFSTDLNEQCMKFLEGQKPDLELLKKMVQENTQQLHRITTSLWVARIELANQNRREAEKLLTRIVELAPQLYPGQEAAKMLAALPGNAMQNS